MNDSSGDFIAGAFLGFLLGMALAIWATTGYWHHQTIWHHAAHYDTTTGAWQWNTTNTTTFTP